MHDFFEGLGRLSSPGVKACRRQMTASESMPENGWRYKKAGNPAFFVFFYCFLPRFRCFAQALEVDRLMPGTSSPQCVVGAAARALDDQKVGVAFSQFFAAVLAAQFWER